MNRDKVKQKLEDLAEEVFQYDEDGKEVKYCGVDHSPEDCEGIKVYNPSEVKVYLNGVEITGFMNDEDFI